MKIFYLQCCSAQYTIYLTQIANLKNKIRIKDKVNRFLKLKTLNKT